MEELKQILLSHGARYPKMEPRDAVKLIYQNEFGGGHLIRDEASCLAYLRREYESVAQTSGDLAEEIGNGLVRIHLTALDAHGYSPEELGAYFNMMKMLADYIANDDTLLERYNSIGQLIKKYVKSNLSRKLTLKDIARNLHCSTVTLTEHFKC